MPCRVENPPNPYHSQWASYLEPPPPAVVTVYREEARSVLSRNDSPDVPFTWSVNPYRGCQHACAYCYARPYHEYLDLGAGTDFDTQLFVKVNAAEVLRRELRAAALREATISFSGVTDCYQPLEAVWQLTRQCLAVCLESGNPVGVVTKSFLVVRDAALLAELGQRCGAEVHISIPFADETVSRLMEPQAPRPARRFEALRRLADHGVRAHVMIAPIIPGLNDREIPHIVEQAAAHGARSASMTVLRLPGSTQHVFLQRLRAAMPLRASRIEARIREVRDGQLTESRFGRRMTGEGRYWDSVARLFEVHCARVGLRPSMQRCLPKPATAAPPPGVRQLEFGF